MKRIGIFFLTFAAALWAAPHEHRDSYFSVGTGVAYSNFETSEDHNSYRCRTDGSCEHGAVEDVTEFSGVSPALNFRFGRSFGNAVAVYGDIDFVLISGAFETSWKLSYQDLYQNRQTISQSSTWNETAGGFLSGGLGIEVYPFRNPNSVMRGFHFGNAYSVGYYRAEIKKHTPLLNDMETKADATVFLYRTDIGMDWWVSETWTIGVEFAYTTPLYKGNNLSDMNSFRLLFRITRG